MNTYINQLNTPQAWQPGETEEQKAERLEREEADLQQRIENGVLVTEAEMADVARSMGLDQPR